MAKDKKERTYDAAFAELRQILADLQAENVSIDALEEQVTRAKELVQFCREKLRDTEAKIQKLTES